MGRRAKGVGLVAALGLWLSLSALAQDYEIRIHRPVKVGQTYHEKANGTQKQKVTVTVNGQVVQQKDDDFSIDFEADVTVLEVGKNGEASKESYSVAKCEVVREGAREAVLAPGSILVATAGDANTKFEAQGGPVPPLVAEALSLVIGVEKDTETDDECYGTRERKKVGDSWQVNSEAMARNLHRHKAEAQKQNIDGTMTLAGLAQVDGVPCLDIRGTMTFKNVAFPVAPGLTMQKQSATVTFEAKIPVDTSLGRPEESSKMSMELRATGRPNPHAGEVILDLTLEKNAFHHRTFPK